MITATPFASFIDSISIFSLFWRYSISFSRMRASYSFELSPSWFKYSSLMTHRMRFMCFCLPSIFFFSAMFFNLRFTEFLLADGYFCTTASTKLGMFSNDPCTSRIRSRATELSSKTSALSGCLSFGGIGNLSVRFTI